MTSPKPMIENNIEISIWFDNSKYSANMNFKSVQSKQFTVEMVYSKNQLICF